MKNRNGVFLRLGYSYMEAARGYTKNVQFISIELCCMTLRRHIRSYAHEFHPKRSTLVLAFEIKVRNFPLSIYPCVETFASAAT